LSFKENLQNHLAAVFYRRDLSSSRSLTSSRNWRRQHRHFKPYPSWGLSFFSLFKRDWMDL